MLDIQSVYDRWEGANEEYLEACRGRFVAVTYSAGKDSSGTLFLLHRVHEKYGFEVGAFVFTYPVHRYPPGTVEPLRAFWEPKLDLFFIRETDRQDDILDAAEACGEDPCRPCQDLRKSALPEIFPVAKKQMHETVIASGHSLWDLAGYALDQFAEKELNATSQFDPETQRKRFLEVSQRFYPFLTMPEGYSVYRPMLFLNADEIVAICTENSLPLLGTTCRYSQKRPKKVLSGYFERFGFRFTYEGVADFAHRFLDIPERQEFERLSREEYLTERF